MLLTGTNKIKGILSLSLGKTILEVGKGKTVSLSSSDAKRAEVQMAINSGYLEVSGSADPDDYEKKALYKNVYTRDLTMNIFSHPIAPGQVFSVSEEEFNSPDIRAAIKRGFIRPADSPAKSEIKEEKVNISDLMTKKTEKHGLDMDDAFDTNEEIVLSDAKTVNKRYNTPIIDSENPEPIIPPDIPHTSTVWDPSDGGEAYKKLNKVYQDAKKRDIQFTPNNEETDIDFVDKNKSAQDLDFIDQEQGKNKKNDQL